ncbi:hypothetical protein KCP74_22315 [Salmonella enterica subsp. enterica]|nr:hypothetical protein KCP74_22315 [Salmonella enterica subsp. enterica]
MLGGAVRRKNRIARSFRDHEQSQCHSGYPIKRARQGIRGGIFTPWRYGRVSYAAAKRRMPCPPRNPVIPRAQPPSPL